MQRRPFAQLIAALVLLASAPHAALAEPAAPGKIVRLTSTTFMRNGPPEMYHLGIYVSGTGRHVSVAFDRDTIAPIENASATDVGDDDVALPSDQRYLRVTIPQRFRDRLGKISVQLSDGGQLSEPSYIYIRSSFAVP